MPDRICKEIGYNLIPALRLIVADTSKLDRAALEVVDRCEGVRLRLITGLPTDAASVANWCMSTMRSEVA